MYTTAAKSEQSPHSMANSIIAAIENGASGKDWRMPWHMDASTAFSPASINGLKPYRGINTVVLWSAAQRCGYDSALWGTYDSWQSIGGQVRKGEKGQLVCYWGTYEKQGDGPVDEDGKRTGLFCKGYTVFNLGQVDGDLGKLRSKVELTPKWQRIEHAEDWFSRTGAKIVHGGNRAYYTSGEDYVRMPQREQFDEADAYYSTLAHECGHWTGHKSRLDRTFGKRFGDDAYAVEELVAELTAAYTMANLRLSNEPRQDHARYLDSWLKVLKADKRALFTAASSAQKAADYLRERASAAVSEEEIGRASCRERV